MKKVSKILADAALLVTKKSVNSSCYFLLGQPKLPKGAEKLKDK